VPINRADQSHATRQIGHAGIAQDLAHDFASVRALAFPGDKRRLMDMRRSGVIEAVAGDAGPLGLAAKLANSIGRSNTLHQTYAPVDIEAVLKIRRDYKGDGGCVRRTKAGQKSQKSSLAESQIFVQRWLRS
jgi:hypothetical protein